MIPYPCWLPSASAVRIRNVASCIARSVILTLYTAELAVPKPRLAGQGASLRELMERMGHSSARAALIYQHATQERDEAIAADMGKLLRQTRRKAQGAGGAGT